MNNDERMGWQLHYSKVLNPLVFSVDLPFDNIRHLKYLTEPLLSFAFIKKDGEKVWTP